MKCSATVSISSTLLLALWCALAAAAGDTTPKSRAASASGAASPSATATATPGGDLPDSTEIAVLGGQRYTAGQLPVETAVQLAQLKRRVELQKRQLDLEAARSGQGLIETQANLWLDQKVLRLEGDLTHKPPDQLLKDLPAPNVTDAAVRAFYDQHSQQINKPFDAISDKVRAVLVEQAAEESKRKYLDSLRGKFHARVTLAPLREPVAATGPARGSEHASVTIVEFADFQCPYCQQMEPVLSQLLARYPNDVRLVYRHFPLTGVHPDAMRAADAAFCAGEQGRFWEMHDALFANQAALGSADLEKTAARLKLDVAAYKTCLSSPKTEAAVSADASAAENAGLTGTPGIFVNGRFFNGAIPIERLASVIDDELARNQPPAPVKRVAGRAAASGSH